MSTDSIALLAVIVLLQQQIVNQTALVAVLQQEEDRGRALLLAIEEENDDDDYSQSSENDLNDDGKRGRNGSDTEIRSDKITRHRLNADISSSRHDHLQTDILTRGGFEARPSYTICGVEICE